MQYYRQCLEKSKLLFLSDELICISSKSDSQKESWRLYISYTYIQEIYVRASPRSIYSLQGACYCSYNMFLIMNEYGNGVLSW